MPGESSPQEHGQANDNSVFMADDSDVSRIFVQVTGKDISPELLDRIAGASGPSGKAPGA